MSKSRPDVRKITHGFFITINGDTQASTLTAGPTDFFHLLWPVGPVALAVHWPERASDHQFGPQGVCSALAV